MIVNVNKILMDLAKELKGYEISPDIYDGQSDKWAVFSYTDERGSLYADNDEEAVTAQIQLNVYTPKDYNYMHDKKIIKDYLRKSGFSNISFMAWVDQDQHGTEYMRHQVWEFEYTVTDKEEE